MARFIKIQEYMFAINRISNIMIGQDHRIYMEFVDHSAKSFKFETQEETQEWFDDAYVKLGFGDAPLDK